MEQECEFLMACPIFQKFSLQSTKNVYVTTYCKGSRLDDCERRKLRRAGREAPLTLLPDGSQMML